MSLDLFRRFGWELLCEPRVSVIGLQIVPLLAVRCSLLHSLVLVLSLSCLCVYISVCIFFPPVNVILRTSFCSCVPWQSAKINYFLSSLNYSDILNFKFIFLMCVCPSLSVVFSFCVCACPPAAASGRLELLHCVREDSPAAPAGVAGALLKARCGAAAFRARLAPRRGRATRRLSPQIDDGQFRCQCQWFGVIRFIGIRVGFIGIRIVRQEPCQPECQCHDQCRARERSRSRGRGGRDRVAPLGRAVARARCERESRRSRRRAAAHARCVRATAHAANGRGGDRGGRGGRGQG